MKISYADEIYHIVYKQFLSAIDHLDYHPSMNNTKHTVTHKPVDTKTSLAETLHIKCDIYTLSPTS